MGGGGGEERLGEQGRQAIRQAVRRRFVTPELKGLSTKTFPFSFSFMELFLGRYFTYFRFGHRIGKVTA